MNAVILYVICSCTAIRISMKCYKQVPITVREMNRLFENKLVHLTMLKYGMSCVSRGTKHSAQESMIPPRSLAFEHKGY